MKERRGGRKGKETREGREGKRKRRRRKKGREGKRRKKRALTVGFACYPQPLEKHSAGPFAGRSYFFLGLSL
jgi:hypothetical protein